MLSTVLLLIFTSFTLLLLYLFNAYQKAQTSSKGIPGPEGIPILGNALEFKEPRDILRKFMEYKEKYGRTFKVMLGTQLLIITCEKDILEHFLTSYKYLSKNFMYRNWRNWLKDGLLVSTGNKWKARRKLITPTFHFKILEDFVEVFDRAGGNLVRKMKGLVGQDRVDLLEPISLCTLDVILETAMGISIDAQNKVDSDYVQSVHTSTKIIIERSFSPIQSNDFLYFFTPNFWKERKALNIIHSMTREVIKKKRLEFVGKSNNQGSNEYNNVDDDLGIKKKRAFLDLLLNATLDGHPLSDDDIQEEVDTFMFEGHDTTNSAISFIIYALADNQDIQSKVFAEQKSIFSSKDELVSHQNTQDMKYLEMVIKEAQRYYPTVPIIARVLPENEVVGGFSFPKGQSVALFQYGTHHDPGYFPNPEKFDPERFCADFREKSNFTYFPFSAGPRNCIGQKFAMLEMKILLSKLTRSFVFLPTVPRHEVDLSSETVLRSHNGIYIKLEERPWN